MKYLFIFPLIIGFLFSCSHLHQPNKTKPLGAEWSFRKANDSLWYPAQIPGNVHGDLMRNGLIENPFYGTNENKIQWIEKTDWQYVGRFHISKNKLKYNHIECLFEGLDTYTEVFLNQHKILVSENMFLAYKKEIKPFLVEGENKIEVLFKSPINKAMSLWKKAGITYPADNDKSKEHLSVFTRKAAYQYGWDWGPRLVTSGIWRPINLRFWNDVKFDDLYIIQKEISAKRAILKLDYKIIADNNIISELVIKLNKSILISKKIKLDSGINHISIPLTITKPKLWWPNGMGNPNLYEIKTTLTTDGHIVAHFNKKIGLRTIEVINKPDSLGESFYFKINGRAVYIKGANYIPNSSFAGEVNDSIYEKVFLNAKSSHFNMLRVWGGGYYENDKFYKLADEYGILIWQDFMFACTTYPSNSAFMKNIEEEVVYNIKRLRNHACLALWCGNNEIEVGWKNWGWQKSYGWSDSVQNQMWEGYKQLFHHLLPNLVEKLDSGRFYFPSSPISNWGNKSDFNFGDNHFWGVWWGKMPFSSFNHRVPRFMSEFGFQSLPSIQSIAQFADSSEWNLNSPTMISHQKSSIGNTTILEYLGRNYGKPKDFEDLVYLNQVMQAEGMRIGIEAQRRYKPFNMGCLYWQFNDVWPGISWSGIDYYGRWKAMQYFVKKAYAPIIASAIYENDSLQIHLISDLPSDQDVNIELKIMTFWGDIIWRKNENVGLLKSENLILIRDELKNLVASSNPNNLVLVMNLSYDSVKLESCFTFDKAKILKLQKPDILINIKVINGEYLINLKTNTFVKNLELSSKAKGIWSDNYFDMIPHENYIVKFETGEIIPDFSKALKLKSVWDTKTISLIPAY